MIYRDMGPLQGKGWLRESKQRAFGLGLRVVAFAIIGFLLHVSLGKASVYPAGWGLAVAIDWVLVCLATGWAMTHFAAQRSRVAWPVIVVLGAVPGVIFAYWTMISIFHGLSEFASGSMLAFAGAGLLDIVAAGFLFAATVAPAIVFTFSLHGAAREGEATGFGVSLLGGAKAMGRGVIEAIIYLPAAVVHKDTRKTLFESGKLTVTLMFIIANALILKHVLTDEQIPQHIASAMLSAGFGPIMFLVIVNVILLIGGQFMEPSGLLFTIDLVGGIGNPTYQWFSNTTNTNSGGTAIAGATNNNYDTGVLSTIGVFYYYIEVTLDGVGCDLAISDVFTVNVVQDPVIDTQPIDSQEICQNTTLISLRAIPGYSKAS